MVVKVGCETPVLDACAAEMDTEMVVDKEEH